MLSETEARDILETRVKDGAKLLVAGHADLPSIKQLQDRCHRADIPAMLGPCASGG